MQLLVECPVWVGRGNRAIVPTKFILPIGNAKSWIKTGIVLRYAALDRISTGIFKDGKAKVSTWLMHGNIWQHLW